MKLNIGQFLELTIGIFLVVNGNIFGFLLGVCFIYDIIRANKLN